MGDMGARRATIAECSPVNPPATIVTLRPGAPVLAINWKPLQTLGEIRMIDSMMFDALTVTVSTVFTDVTTPSGRKTRLKAGTKFVPDMFKKRAGEVDSDRQAGESRGIRSGIAHSKAKLNHHDRRGAQAQAKATKAASQVFAPAGVPSCPHRHPLVPSLRAKMQKTRLNMVRCDRCGAAVTYDDIYNVKVELMAGPLGFGLRFGGAIDASYAQQGHGIFVSGVNPESPAESHSDVKVGLQILELNGVDLRTGTFKELAAVLRGATEKLTLTMATNPGLYRRHAALSVDSGAHVPPRGVATAGQLDSCPWSCDGCDFHVCKPCYKIVDGRLEANPDLSGPNALLIGSADSSLTGTGTGRSSTAKLSVVALSYLNHVTVDGFAVVEAGRNITLRIALGGSTFRPVTAVAPAVGGLVCDSTPSLSSLFTFILVDRYLSSCSALRWTSSSPRRRDHRPSGPACRAHVDTQVHGTAPA